MKSALRAEKSDLIELVLLPIGCGPLGTGLPKRWIDSFGSSICPSHHLDRAISAGVPVTVIPVICALIGAAFGLLIGYGFGWARAMRDAKAMLAPKSGPVL